MCRCQRAQLNNPSPRNLGKSNSIERHNSCTPPKKDSFYCFQKIASIFIIHISPRSGSMASLRMDVRALGRFHSQLQSIQATVREKHSSKTPKVLAKYASGGSFIYGVDELAALSTKNNFSLIPERQAAIVIAKKQIPKKTCTSLYAARTQSGAQGNKKDRNPRSHCKLKRMTVANPTQLCKEYKLGICILLWNPNTANNPITARISAPRFRAACTNFRIILLLDHVKGNLYTRMALP